MIRREKIELLRRCESKVSWGTNSYGQKRILLLWQSALTPWKLFSQIFSPSQNLLSRIFDRDHARLKKGEYADSLGRLYGRRKTVRELERGSGEPQGSAGGIHEDLR